MQVYLPNELLLFLFGPEGLLNDFDMRRLRIVRIFNILSVDGLHAEDRYVAVMTFRRIAS